MKKFVETIKNIWRVDELRNRILLTLGLILVYRIGSFIIIPGVDQGELHFLARLGGEGGGVKFHIVTGLDGDLCRLAAGRDGKNNEG